MPSPRLLTLLTAGIFAAVPFLPAEPDTEAITRAIPAEAYADPAKPRRILVFSVTNGFRHKSIPWGKAAFRLMGEKTGAWTATVSDDLAHFEADKLSTFDAVVFNNTTQNVFLPHSKEMGKLDEEAQREARARAERLQQNLLAFIRSGKGFIGIHAATDTFYDWPAFGSMIGGYFNGHPWGANTPVSIRVMDPDHPLQRGLRDTSHLEFKEECYQFKDPYRKGRQHVLLRLDTKRTNMNVKGIKRSDGDFPLAWIRTFGDGRVFYSALGHNEHIYANPKVLAHYLAGFQWAIGDLKAPTPPGDR